MSDCKLCTQWEKGDDWEEGDLVPYCAFKSGAFDADNWACETMYALRELVEAKGTKVWARDQQLGVYPIDEAGRFLVMTWYKHRAKIEMAVVFDSEDIPKPLTLAQAELILSGKGLPYDDSDELAPALN